MSKTNEPTFPLRWASARPIPTSSTHPRFSVLAGWTKLRLHGETIMRHISDNYWTPQTTPF